MITEEKIRTFFAARLRFLAARSRVPSPRARFSRYIHHDTWHVCRGDQRDLSFDDGRWIEVAW
jgi:hypothetical protein